LLVFDKEQNYAASIPFLLPDADPTTSQTSSIDKSFSIIRSVLRKKGIDLVGEGKDVFVFDPATKQFSWVVTDQLDENKDVLNPIDTLPARYKLSGDYVKDKKNIVSIRDGRYPNQLVLFVHFENGECKGELKGNLIMTSSTSAVYRQSGDPCVLQLKFTGSTVTLNEEQGCANYRGIDCAFTGSFTKKKIKPASRTSKETKK
jgi:hypothetical protein